MAQTFADRLALALHKRGLSQYRLAKSTGWSAAYVSQLMSGERPLPRMANKLVKLGEVLNVPLDWLVNGKAPQPVFDEPLTSPPVHDTRARAIAIVRGEIPDEIIARAELETAERTIYQWIQRMQALEALTQTDPASPTRSTIRPARSKTIPPSTKRSI